MNLFSSLPAELRMQCVGMGYLDARDVANYASTQKSAMTDLVALPTIKEIAALYRLTGIRIDRIPNHLAIMHNGDGIMVGFPKLQVTVPRAINIYSANLGENVQNLDDPTVRNEDICFRVRNRQGKYLKILLSENNSDFTLEVAGFELGRSYEHMS